MRYELRSIGVWAFVRASFLLHLVFGFVLGLFYAAIFGLILALASSLPYGDTGDMGFDPGTIGPVFVIMLPFIMAVGVAVFGTIFTAIMVIVYNLVVKMVGGIEFELEPTALAPVYASTPAATPRADVAMYPPPPPPPPPASNTTPTYNPPPAPPRYDWTPPPNGQPRDPDSESR